ncbi:hypothetical protein EDD17DRAFT_1553236 [Pisolithus thermaeus]|nr:hypothetical protein EV401DRAFT_89665 [Pisolithus croceorrhizus]KAI6165789.1 hypothetical protein EDD17DRAFT_1553236 [Pisolithus thermaeus]
MSEKHSNNPYYQQSDAPSRQSEYPAPPQESYPAPSGPPPEYLQPPSDYPHQGYTPYPQEASQSAVYNPTPLPSTHLDRSPSPNGRGGGLSLASFFGNQGPPSSWQRPPPSNLPYNQFPPMCLISNGKDLAKGFPELPPPCQLAPHPFATHDVTEEDWKRFLTDVKKGASLTGAQRIKSNVIPLVAGLSFVGGLFMTHAIEQKMKSKNRTAAGDVVDHWNHYFFGPRRMEVVLSQGSERLSGREGPAPLADPMQQRMANDLRHRNSSASFSSSSSSDSEDGRRFRGGFGRGHNDFRDQRRALRAERRAARGERHEERRARREERRNRRARGEDQVPYQLFIQPV